MKRFDFFFYRDVEKYEFTKVSLCIWTGPKSRYDSENSHVTAAGSARERGTALYFLVSLIV